MILLIDNYDSFSYNLYQLIGSINPDIEVVRNDQTTVMEIEDLAPSHIILSPGPGRPCDSGICTEVVKTLGGKVPIFGVCLGLQVIFEAYGGIVSYAARLMHGKKSQITLDIGCEIFHGLPVEIEAARYHSLSAVRETMPDELAETARSSDGEVMAVRRRGHKVFGVQFHPESIMTPFGRTILENFLSQKESGTSRLSL